MTSYNPADFKLGDVAMVTLAKDHPLGQVTLRGLRASDFDGEHVWQLPDTGFLARSNVVESARPLVVLDPESDEDVERLRKEYDRHLAASAEGAGHYVAFLHSADQRTDALRAALRAMTRPPKPDEPKGLGAVVQDRSGDLWVRMNEVHFERLGTVSGNRQTWGELDVPPDAVRFGGVS